MDGDEIFFNLTETIGGGGWKGSMGQKESSEKNWWTSRVNKIMPIFFTTMQGGAKLA